MKLKVVLTHDGKRYSGELDLAPTTSIGTIEVKAAQVSSTPKAATGPAKIFDQMFKEGFFSVPRSLPDARKELEKHGYHFGKSSIFTALERADYLQKAGSKRSFTFVQKYPAT